MPSRLSRGLCFGIVTALSVAIVSLAPTKVQAVFVLVGMTGDGGSVSETLYTISTSNAFTTEYMALPNGNDGDALAFNPDDGLLYHGSGNDGGKIFESVNLLTKTTTLIPITGPTALNEEFTGLTYNTGGSFFASFRGGNFLRTLDTAGAEVDLGGGFPTNHGLAFLSTGELISANISSMAFSELSTVDGSVTSTITVSSTIAGATGFTGFARNSDDDTLWGIVRIGSQFDRRLVRIDNFNLVAGTADAVEIGDLGDRFNALAFVDENFIDVPDIPLTVQIDRDTGEVVIANTSPSGTPVDIKGYSIRSVDGTLNETNFTPLADSDTDWIQLTATGARSDLSEGHLTTGSIPVGTTSLGAGTWDNYYKDGTDITFTWIDENNNAVVGPVEFAGNGDASFAFLDLNFDGVIDIGDWTEFKNNYGSDLTGVSVAQGYRQSDLTGDGLHDILDVNEFRKAYDAALGAGSFALAVSSVPEPSTVVLLALAGSLLLGFRTRTSLAKHLRSGISMKYVGTFVAAALVSLLFTSSAVAQQVFFEDFEGLTLIDAVDRGSDGDDETDWNTVADSGLGALGWTMDARTTPLDTTEPLNNEYYGWTVWDFSWWLDEQGDQVGRSQFLPGLQPNNTMIGVDPDAHDDVATGGVGATGFTSILRSPMIDISGITANSLVLTFNETWAEEDIQEAVGNFIIDGSPTEFLHYTSAGGDPNFLQPDLLNNTVVVNIPNDPSDSTLQITWDMPQAGNDWFWGLDNVAINGLPTLQVDTADGDLAILGGATQEIWNYEISSPSGLLDPTSWAANNLDAEDFDADGAGVGEAWETVGGTEEQLVEAFLLGTTPFNTGVVEPIGTGFDFAAAGGTEDLIFRITTADGTVLTGLVEYTTGVPTNVVSTAVAGDYSGNGIVDAEDYTIWRDNLGAADESAFAPGTGNGGGVDATDYTFWKGNFGNISGSGSLATAEVPEPTSIALVAGLGLLLLGARRR